MCSPWRCSFKEKRSSLHTYSVPHYLFMMFWSCLDLRQVKRSLWLSSSNTTLVDLEDYLYTVRCITMKSMKCFGKFLSIINTRMAVKVILTFLKFICGITLLKLQSYWYLPFLTESVFSFRNIFISITQKAEMIWLFLPISAISGHNDLNKFHAFVL